MADLTSAQRNAINTQLRQQPWYQAWFRAKGLNPNQVKLSDAQRKELAQVASANGMPIPDHTLIDEAGNVNIQHGFAGLPMWAKVAIGAGAAVAGGVGAGALLGAAGGGSGAALGAGEAATTLGATGGIVPGLAAAAPVVAPVAGAGVPAAAAGSIWSRLAPSLIGVGAQAVASGLTARAAGKAADQQSEAADKALALQRDIFNQTQANQRPFIDVGTGAATRLNSLMGGGPLSSLGASQTPSQGMPQQQQAQPPQMVQMKAPDGSVQAVPFTDVPHFEQRGAVRVF